MPIRVDKSRVPLVVVTWEGVVSDAEMKEYLQQMDGVVAMPERRALVYDARDASVPSAPQRRMQAEWMKRNDARIKATTVGTAFVIDSAIVRGALTAVFWIQGMSSEHLVCATLDEGIAWAKQRLSAAGISLRFVSGG